MTLNAWKLLSIAAAFMAATPVLAQSADRVATHSDWSVFVAANPKECYIVSAPKSSVARRDGKPTDVTRGDIRLFVSFRPGEKVANEVSFTGGYPLRAGTAVKVALGSETFSLNPGPGDASGWAWPAPSCTMPPTGWQTGRVSVLTALRRSRGARKSSTGGGPRGRTRVAS